MFEVALASKLPDIPTKNLPEASSITESAVCCNVAPYKPLNGIVTPE